ncbi:MAG: hypothetical protein JXB45_02430 [Candidatus Krumholzibacteriota bacterium]|nr:hypothetical protein [Candidatus Krumholzibacteriota bacterium]
MKKILPTILPCVLIVLINCSCTKRCPDEPGVYCDPQKRFHITFPAGWTVNADPGGNAAVVAEAPLEEGKDPERTRTTFEVIVLPLMGNPSREEYFNAYRKGLAQDSPFYEEADRGELSIGRRKTSYILYQMDAGIRIEGVLAYVQVKGSNAYLFRGVTRAIQFNSFHDTFRQTAYTFKLL